MAFDSKGVNKVDFNIRSNLFLMGSVVKGRQGWEHETAQTFDTRMFLECMVYTKFNIVRVTLIL